MSVYVHKAIRALRHFMVAGCLVLLVGSLILWPRSYFHEDGLLILPPHASSNWHLFVVGVNSRMGKVGLGWQGGDPDRVKYLSRQYGDVERRYELLHPAEPYPITVGSRGHLVHASADIWVVVAGALLLLYVTTRQSLRDLTRFRVSHLLWGTVAVAMMTVASQINGRPAYAMVGEWAFLAIVCVVAAHRSFRKQSAERWLWGSVSLAAFVGLVALAIYYQLCVATVEPLA